MSAEARQVWLLGVRIDDVTWPEIDRFCEAALAKNGPSHLVTVNGEHILAAEQDRRHREIINHADLVIPDTTNVVWVSRLKGRGLRQITPGADLVQHLAQLALVKNKSLYLLGSRGEIAHQAAAKLRQLYPGLRIAGASNKDPDDLTAVQDIKQSGAEIVLVAYGAPTHEYWIHDHKAETGAKILVGIGGVFDMLAGVLPRAPEFFRALRLEWLWRLIIQPSRFGRVWNAIVVFPLRALLKK